MDSQEKVTLSWYGTAHYHIAYRDVRIVIDPLYTRPSGDRPHLTARKEDLDRLDYLLLTHGHMDHSWDFPYLAARHRPAAYAPGAYLSFMREMASNWSLQFDASKFHSLDEAKGNSFSISDIEVTPYQIGTEELDFWFFRTMVVRPLKHWAFGAVPAAAAFLRYHLRENCFAYHFRFPERNTTMLYLGNLTDGVDDLKEIERVSILALPFCPANRKWLSHTAFLIGRFRPDVAMIHHFDDFWHPYTDATYRDLGGYRRVVCEAHPDQKLYFSKFGKQVELAELTGWLP